MEKEEDYFAPLGMSQSDFNSMIRRRNLANLTQHLVEQGRVIMPGTSVVPSKTAQLMEVEDGVGSFPEPLVADVENIARRSSSFYCRGIDEDSPRFATFFDGACGRAGASESQSPTYVPTVSRKRSKRASLSSFFPGFTRVTSVSSSVPGTTAPKAKNCSLPLHSPVRKTPKLSAIELQTLSSSCPASTASRATSVSFYNPGTVAAEARYRPPLSLQSPVKETRRTSVTKLRALESSFPATSWRSASVDSYCSGTAAPKAEYHPCKIDPWFYKPKTTRMSDTEPHSLPAATSNTDKAGAAHTAPQQSQSRANAREPLSQAPKEAADLDLPKALAALMRNCAQRQETQDIQPPVDRVIELGRLRRVIRTLDFNFDDAIMLASDLTTLVPVPDDDVADRETFMFFRGRLAKTVWRRIETLRRELKFGDALKIEHWYRDVVDLIGWRDEEARMSWSWLERDGFF